MFPSLKGILCGLRCQSKRASAVQELQPRPNLSKPGPRRTPCDACAESDRPRTKICMSFLAGNCQNGDLCLLDLIGFRGSNAASHDFPVSAAASP